MASKSTSLYGWCFLLCVNWFKVSPGACRPLDWMKEGKRVLWGLWGQWVGGAAHKNIEAPRKRRRIECLEEAQLYAAV